MEPLPDPTVPESPQVEKSKIKKSKIETTEKKNYIKSENRTESIKINQSRTKKTRDER